MTANYLGVEHVLLGVLREGDSPAAQTRDSLGVMAGRVRDQLVQLIARGEAFWPGRHHPTLVPVTPMAQQALELALHEALSVRQNYIGPEPALEGATLVLEHDRLELTGCALASGDLSAARSSRRSDFCFAAEEASPRGAARCHVDELQASVWEFECFLFPPIGRTSSC